MYCGDENAPELVDDMKRSKPEVHMHAAGLRDGNLDQPLAAAELCHAAHQNRFKEVNVYGLVLYIDAAKRVR